jgi:hypothetical protein
MKIIFLMAKFSNENRDVQQGCPDLTIILHYIYLGFELTVHFGKKFCNIDDFKAIKRNL